MSTNIGNYSISDVGNEIAGMMHGASLNQIQNLYGVYNRAARRIMQDVDPQEVKVVKSFGQVWDGVFDYPVDTDVKGNRIIDLYPHAARQLTDNFGQQYNKDFDLWKNYTLQSTMTMKYSNGTRTLRVNARNLNTGIQINATDGVSTNGTWVAGTNVSNVQSNNQVYTDGAAGSVTFTLAQTGIASTAYIENSTMGAIDLTTHFNNAYEFFQAYLPNAAGITNIDYRFGTDASNYYEFSALTTDYLGNAWGNGWNALGASWTGASTVGSPTLTNIKYIRVTFTYNGTLQTQVALNQFYSRLGVYFDYEYYSKYLFRDGTTGIFKEKVTADSDVVNLDTDGFNLFIYASALEAIEQQQGLAALFGDMQNFEGKYSDGLAEYQSKYKSEVTKPRVVYYSQPTSGYRRFFGRGGLRLG